VAVVAFLALGPVAGAADPLQVTVSIDGAAVKGSGTKVALRPTANAIVELTLVNNGANDVTIRSMHLDGHVMGLLFYSYQTSVSIKVARGATETRRFGLDLTTLSAQAIGLIPSTVSLFDDSGHRLASQSFVGDVKGSVTSTYGVFGIVLILFTIAAFAVLFWGMARGRLPANRWQRAARFLVPGIGLGLTLVFASSALRIFAPRPVGWLPIIVVCAVAAFVLGYLTPSPEGADDLDEDDDDDLESDDADYAMAGADPATTVRLGPTAPPAPPTPSGPPGEWSPP
jgi:hypothetical protein